MYRQNKCKYQIHAIIIIILYIYIRNNKNKMLSLNEMSKWTYSEKGV